jgi:hypothetical protein
MTQETPTVERRIAEAIRAHSCDCKLLLKTADDPALLPIWLEHHLKIFRPEQIVIADNRSRDPEVLDLYRRLPPGVIVFSYAGDQTFYHNNIHDRARFAWLYEALAASCRYTLFLDTDELLFLSPDLREWRADADALAALLSAAEGRAVSTTWVHPAVASRDTFYVGADTRKLAWDLRWGKPLAPTAYREPGARIHNVQFPLDLFDRDLGAQAYLLHLVTYDRAQRLRVNQRKLAARGAVRADESWEQIFARDVRSADPTVARLMEESRRIHAQTWPSAPDPRLPPDFARLEPGGRVTFGGEPAERTLAAFRADFRALFEAAMAGP